MAKFGTHSIDHGCSHDYLDNIQSVICDGSSSPCPGYSTFIIILIRFKSIICNVYNFHNVLVMCSHKYPDKEGFHHLLGIAFHYVLIIRSHNHRDKIYTIHLVQWKRIIDVSWLYAWCIWPSPLGDSKSGSSVGEHQQRLATARQVNSLSTNKYKYHINTDLVLY